METLVVVFNEGSHIVIEGVTDEQVKALKESDMTGKRYLELGKEGYFNVASILRWWGTREVENKEKKG